MYSTNEHRVSLSTSPRSYVAYTHTQRVSITAYTPNDGGVDGAAAAAEAEAAEEAAEWRKTLCSHGVSGDGDAAEQDDAGDNDAGTPGKCSSTNTTCALLIVTTVLLRRRRRQRRRPQVHSTHHALVEQMTPRMVVMFLNTLLRSTHVLRV